MEDLKETLKKQIIEALSLEEMTPEDITDDGALFGDGLGLDSIDALELIVLTLWLIILPKIAPNDCCYRSRHHLGNR